MDLSVLRIGRWLWEHKERELIQSGCVFRGGGKGEAQRMLPESVVPELMIL